VLREFRDPLPNIATRVTKWNDELKLFVMRLQSQLDDAI
jgi:hypothetical protein